MIHHSSYTCHSPNSISLVQLAKNTMEESVIWYLNTGPGSKLSFSPRAASREFMPVPSNVRSSFTCLPTASQPNSMVAESLPKDEPPDMCDLGARKERSPSTTRRQRTYWHPSRRTSKERQAMSQVLAVKWLSLIVMRSADINELDVSLDGIHDHLALQPIAFMYRAVG